MLEKLDWTHARSSFLINVNVCAKPPPLPFQPTTWNAVALAHGKAAGRPLVRDLVAELLGWGWLRRSGTKFPSSQPLMKQASGQGAAPNPKLKPTRTPEGRV